MISLPRARLGSKKKGLSSPSHCGMQAWLRSYVVTQMGLKNTSDPREIAPGLPCEKGEVEKIMHLAKYSGNEVSGM